MVDVRIITMNIIKKILILLVLLFSTSVSSLVWGAENYDDCILENIKGIGSDVAAKAIIDVCKIEKHYKDGKKDGKWILWHANGQIGLDSQKKGEGNYKDGKLDGKWIWWHANGQILSEKHYKDGKCISGDCQEIEIIGEDDGF